ncbi:hypothetical protein [Sphingomonas qomolangmaensis]|uniref:DUF2975 domain-containing protein n=1 Tax=Sphingomonas qomolangmaensis TaxID=2918765 RepID=A0ABY5LD42_9SPHN|nr:hypothetical protein [Sphingomonas qomolangmaensis]UUL83792.1 hypothetical protein NMP03_06245 [Sphingomonas qomolangmaensis]
MSNLRIVKGARYLTLIVLAFALLGVVLNSTGLLDAERAEGTKIKYLVATLPTVFYLAAIWMIQHAHAAIAKGEAVEAALATLLEHLGICLFLGGVARVFGELWLVRLLLGVSTSQGIFDVAAITLGCVGLLLFVLARPLRDAVRARAELAEIL